MSFLTRAYGATKLAVKAKAPTIMVVSGVVSMGAAVVTAGKQTLKVEDVLAKHLPDLEKINEGLALDLQSYTKEMAAKDRVTVYTRTGLDLAKLYAVPGLLFIGGAGLVFGGHNLMVKRNATLAVAFTGLKTTFDAYRARVQEQLGHEQDQAFMHGSITKEVIDPVTGKVELIETRDWEDSTTDPYNRVFDQATSTQWRPDLDLNRFFVKTQQKFAQERLIREGVLYLSDVYQSLGIPQSDISRVTGWKVGRLEDGSRDIPMVDFGLDKPLPDDWKYNQEKAIYLDFNCQGLVVGGRVQKALERA